MLFLYICYYNIILYNMKSLLKHSTIILFTLFILSSCEDPVVLDKYIETILIEALLIVDQPITQVRLTRTLPLNEPYYYGNALIRNADIFIYENKDKEIKLTFIEYDTANIKQSGYYYQDTTYKVNPNTEYKLKVILDNGNEITGTTTTPNRIEWIKKIDPVFPYPDDTFNLPVYSGGETEWTLSSAFYIYSITCLDTLKYGIYLDPPTDDTNRRIRIRKYNNNNDEPRPVEVTISSLAYKNTMAFNWLYCRWFGKHQLNVYAIDINYARWFLYYLASPNLNDKSYSVKGAAGYFGSASTIEAEFFLQKNKWSQ